MKKLCKILCVITCFIMCINISAIADNTQYADILYELGLFKGTDNGYELDIPFTREQAATMLVRLVGEEDNALSGEYEHQFDDVWQERWSYKYIMYCYENEITKGTSKYFFEPERNISAAEFVTLVLRILGYQEAEPETAEDMAIHNYLLSSEKAKIIFESDKFLRSDMVYVAYRCLKTQTADGVLFAAKLAEKGVISENEAEEFDVFKTGSDIEDIIKSLMD
ncbi:MAG: S-layer homology domain-containing protein [Ruminococcaceae bacterium]|nr:S-layer homology domain-containing protein [Oscillospiraceae bacterium]